MVSKPIQYVGGELNAVTKDWQDVTVHWALMYPDAYEVGAPNQGVQILYEVLNERSDALAERTYAVWPDLEALMRQHRVPQFTVDAHRALGDFDLIGMSFSTELGYTNMLTALDLAQFPVLSADRNDEHPIVVAGGHAAFNPEPIADFIDVAVLGDGEQAVGLITDIVGAWITAGKPGGRSQVLKDLARNLADRYQGTETSLSLPSTRVDAFNVDLANELSRNGRRSGLTFAPEGGSERMRKVINKQVTEDDLIRTVTTAYAAGWRQVKLYFMCGLPTETDDDVLQIAQLAREVIRHGRQITGRRDIRCTVSIGGFVPKPHTPFQWAAQLDHATTDSRLHKLRDAIRADREYGKAIGLRYHDGKPGIVEGLLSRGDRRVGPVILEAWRQGARFDGWSEHFSYDRWMTAAASALDGTGVDVDWFTIRERQQAEVLPWSHLDSGLDADWLWEDWQDALSEQGVDDCRWSPCFDCGVCDQMGTEIQVGPTGVVDLPMPSIAPSPVLAGGT